MTPNIFIRENVTPGDTILSLCCGIGIELKRLDDYDVTGVDICQPYLDEFKRKFPGFKTVKSDVLEYISKAEDQSFDVVSCIDGIEHLPKKDGQKLIEECKRVARKKVFIFTPEGYTKNEPKETWGIKGGDKYQIHLSGWVPEEFEGFTVAYQKPAVSLHDEQYNETMYVWER